jgi:hypothetical protein
VKAAEPAPKAKVADSKASDYDDIPKHLFKAFDLGNIKEIDSTPNNKPPSEEDTIEGRYAAVLFSTAS